VSGSQACVCGALHEDIHGKLPPQGAKRNRVCGAVLDFWKLLSVAHPQGRIDLGVELIGEGEQVVVKQAAVVRTARKIMQGELHLPGYIYG
jgi:2-methylaconitate cis-trans-isomerase PrpF